MFTIEFTHKGIRRQMQTDARTDEMARISFSNIRKQSDETFTLHLDTMKQHATAEDAEAEVQRFRLAHGKSAIPTDAELAQNSREVLTNPAIVIPRDEDELWDE